MKKCAILVLCLLICLSLLAGCACEHTWVEADCVTAKTCSSCGEIEGEVLGHTWVEANCTTAKTCSVCGITEGEPLAHNAGQWEENADVVAATVSRVQHCTACNEQIAAETVPLSTMIQDGIFLFAPNEFMERLAMFANTYVDDFTYEFVPSSTGLTAFAYSNDKQVILQFFNCDAIPLMTDERDEPIVWCVSLTEVGEADADLRQCVFMASDPALDKDTAFQVDINLATAFLNAASAGGAFGYIQHNELLYETVYISGEMMAEDFSMNMVNIYASDFR